MEVSCKDLYDYRQREYAQKQTANNLKKESIRQYLSTNSENYCEREQARISQKIKLTNAVRIEFKKFYDKNIDEFTPLETLVSFLESDDYKEKGVEGVFEIYGYLIDKKLREKDLTRDQIMMPLKSTLDKLQEVIKETRKENKRYRECLKQKDNPLLQRSRSLSQGFIRRIFDSRPSRSLSTAQLGTPICSQDSFISSQGIVCTIFKIKEDKVKMMECAFSDNDYQDKYLSCLFNIIYDEINSPRQILPTDESFSRTFTPKEMSEISENYLKFLYTKLHSIDLEKISQNPSQNREEIHHITKLISDFESYQESLTLDKNDISFIKTLELVNKAKAIFYQDL